MNNLPKEALGKIHQAGRIPFSRLMDLALYGEHGYYSERVQIGRKGADFFTASQSPLFGMTLAQSIETKWKEWGEPERLQIVEVGAGQGELAENILNELVSSGRLHHISYCIVERSQRLLQLQHDRLEKLHFATAVELSWNEPDVHLPTVILANEVLDALPVDVVKRTTEGWGLLSVSVDASDRLTWHWDEAGPETAALANEFINCPQGTYAELCPYVEPLMTDIIGRHEGPVHALWFDYGIFKEEWESGIRPEGTLRAYQEHELKDAFTHLFEADITADVNWTYVESVTQKLGFTTELVSQGQFLFQHGIMDRAVELQQSEPTLLAGSRWTQQLKQLALPGGMGDRFSVLICGRS